MTPPSRALCIAPMMARSDRHFRYLLRLIVPDAYLYTEMITSGALLNGNSQRLLKYHIVEHPLAVQLGGNDADDLAVAAKIVEEAGYDEINLNVGCPSQKVRAGCFGACLMATPERVAELTHRMINHVSIPVTVKTRIGIDPPDDPDLLHTFVNCVKQAGVNTFIIHARKAILNGLNPKQNRTIPALEYERVYELKRAFPELEIVINGGFKTAAAIRQQYAYVDGVMIGRLAYENPYLLTTIDHQTSSPNRYQILEDFLDYMQTNLEQGVPLGRMTKHILGFFAHQPGARAYRRHLSEHIHRRNAGIETVRAAMDKTRNGITKNRKNNKNRLLLSVS